MLNIECKCDNGIWIREKFDRFFKKIDEIGEYLDVSDDFWDRNERQYGLTAMRLFAIHSDDEARQLAGI